MNDLPWIKYKPAMMFMDLIGLSAWAKVSHVALFNYTLINDGPPLNENDTLRDITGCPAADWGRVKRELIGKGWFETPKYFLHRGTIKTLNESKETFVGNQNQTAAANKRTTRHELLPPDPETGVVMYHITQTVTPDVTRRVTSPQEQVQEDKTLPPHLEHEGSAGREIPDEEQAVVQCQVAGMLADEKFIRFVYRQWSMQSGKNANGVIVCWMKYVTHRWVNEQEEWKNGTHRGNKKNANNGKNSPHRIDRSVGTANEGIASHYKGLKQINGKLVRVADASRPTA